MTPDLHPGIGDSGDNRLKSRWLSSRFLNIQNFLNQFSNSYYLRKIIGWIESVHLLCFMITTNFHCMACAPMKQRPIWGLLLDHSENKFPFALEAPSCRVCDYASVNKIPKIMEHNHALFSFSYCSFFWQPWYSLRRTSLQCES